MFNCILAGLALSVTMQTDGPLLRLNTIESSYNRYTIKTRYLQCHAVMTHYTDGINDIKQEVYSVHSDKAYVHAVKTHMLNGVTESSRPFVILVHKNDYGYDVYFIISGESGDEFKSIAPETLFTKKNWLIQNEAHKGKQENNILEYYYTTKAPAPILSGYELIPGINYKLPDCINKDNMTIDKADDSGDITELHYHGGKSELYKYIINGSAKLMNKHGFLVAEGDVKYGGIIMNKWKGKSGHTTNTYTAIGDIMVLQKREHTAIAVDDQGKDHVFRTLIEYTISKIDNDIPFQLASYGLPERTARHPVEETEESAEQPQESSSIEKVPLWGWLTALAISFLIGGLLLQKRKRPMKAT